MDRLRLAICTSGELFGGVERFVLSLASYLHRETDVDLFVVLWCKNELYRRLGEEDIEVAVASSKFKNDYRAVGKLHRFFKDNRIDVVHANGYKADILCALPAKRCGARFVKTQHGKLEPCARHDLKWLRMLANALVDYIVTRRYADHVVYVTHELRRSLSRNDEEERCSVIYNGIAPISASSDPDCTDVDGDKFNIGIVGRLGTVKGHIYLLRALLRLRQRDNVRAYFFGTGGLEDELRDFCRREGLVDSVRFMGFREDVLQWVAALDAFIMPSLHEGLPYALLESMHLGVPIIASRVGGLAEVLEDRTDAVLVEPGDEKELAAAIELLIVKPDMRATLADNAKAKACTHFAIDRMVQEYLAVYAAGDSGNPLTATQ